MEYQNIYNIISGLLFLFLGSIWTKDYPNIVLKFIFLLLAIFSGMLVFYNYGLIVKI